MTTVRIPRLPGPQKIPDDDRVQSAGHGRYEPKKKKKFANLIEQVFYLRSPRHGVGPSANATSLTSLSDKQQ